MITLHKSTELRATIRHQRQRGRRIAFVPTMGNLHEGHIALVNRAHRSADYVVTSIYVNPMQFGAGEDLATYPRTLEADQAKLVNAGNHLLYLPGTAQIYPLGPEAHTRVAVPEISTGYCGDSRPGHFAGVATVVSILFNQVQPDVALFGEKDFQQVAVIRKMVRDLSFPIEIETIPTLRESDGLAMSSRNGYLSKTERELAPILYQTLTRAAGQVSQPAVSLETVCAEARKSLSDAGLTVEYFAAADSHTLLPAEESTASITLLTAARIGTTRLIDNVTVKRSPMASNHRP